MHAHSAGITATGHGCGQSSADLQSAVSPICNRQGSGCLLALRAYAPSAECNSAIQQIENLRYFVTGPGRPGTPGVTTACGWLVAGLVRACCFEGCSKGLRWGYGGATVGITDSHGQVSLFVRCGEALVPDKLFRPRFRSFSGPAGADGAGSAGPGEGRAGLWRSPSAGNQWRSRAERRCRAAGRPG